MVMHGYRDRHTGNYIYCGCIGLHHVYYDRALVTKHDVCINDAHNHVVGNN